MDVEIIDFFPGIRYEKFFDGTLKIKITFPCVEFILMGIYVSKNALEKWFFGMAYKFGVDHETGRPNKYPVFVFEDSEQTEALMNEIREKGQIFVEQRLLNTENPIVFRERRQPESKQHKQLQPKIGVAEINKTASSAKNKAEPTKGQYNDKKPCNGLPVQKKAAVKEWVDPPPRKTPIYSGGQKNER